MTILYALVARGTVVLAEFSAASGNASTIARRILEKIPAGGDSRVSYSQDRHIFHIMKADGLTFLCMASDTFGSKMMFPLPSCFWSARYATVRVLDTWFDLRCTLGYTGVHKFGS